VRSVAISEDRFRHRGRSAERARTARNVRCKVALTGCPGTYRFSPGLLMFFASKPRRRRRRPAGQSLVELALILPVFLLLLLTSLDLGRLMYSQIAITNAAKEGALVASQGGTFQSDSPCDAMTNTVMCGVVTEAKGGFVEVDQAKVDLQPAVCDDDAPYPSTGSPPDVTVSVEAPFHVLTPIIGAFVGSDPTLSATAEAQCLAVPDVAFAPIPSPTPCPEATVPVVDGLDAPTAANNAITAVGLTPNGLPDVTTGPKGKASSQSPAAGACVSAGTSVTYHYRPS
jgi:Flp pilus assembly protein TadG